MKILYNYIDGVARCEILDIDGTLYVGEAHCHPEDIDMMSEKTGLYIAEMRANIKYLKHLIKYSKKELKSLIDFHSLLKFNPHYNENNLETKLLIREIRRRKKDIEENKKVLEDMQFSLREYIVRKDEFYQKIRKNRIKGQK